MAVRRATAPKQIKPSPATNKSAKPSSVTLAALDRAAAWTPPLVEAAFAEHKAETVARLVPIIERRDLFKTGVAYKTLQVLLFHLVTRPKLDAAPLFPVLERFVEYPTWNPDKMRQFELVRTYSMRLLARAKHPSVGVTLRRFLTDFPESVEREAGSGMLYALAEIALDLGDKSIAPLFAPLLERMLPKHAARQRENAIGPTRDLIAKLARKR